jgi:hypothetical protein
MQLTFSAGAPSTVKQQHTWGNRFAAFCKNTLKHKEVHQSTPLFRSTPWILICPRADQVPKGQDIERFVIAIVDVTKSRCSNSDALSHSWIVHGVDHTIAHCPFNWPDDFKISRGNELRINSVIANLEKQRTYHPRSLP